METARDREILETLTELALEVATALKAQIVTEAAAGNAESADRLSLAFTRVGRSIRQTLAFKAKLAEMAAKAVEKHETKVLEQAIAASRLRFKKQKIARDVAEMMESQRAPEDLLTDLRERLEDPDIEEEMLTVRVGDVIMGLCDDFNILIDRTVWQDKGWYLAENRPVVEAPKAPPLTQSTQALIDEALRMIEETTTDLGPPDPSIYERRRPADDG